MEDLGVRTAVPAGSYGDLRSVLVTGAAGSVGREVCRELSAAGVGVVAVERPGADASAIEGLPGVEVVRCGLDDVRRLPSLVPDRDVDACVHLAWEGSVGVERGYGATQLRDVGWALGLVHACAAMGVRRLVGAGSLAELDVLAYSPTDGATPNLVSHYGTAKLAAHFMTKAECASLGMGHVWCRLANTYGAGCTANNFVMMAARTMLSGGRAAFTAGEQAYDFVYVTDTARAVCHAAARGRANCCYYLGSGEHRRLRDYIVSIRDAVDPAIELHLGEVPFNGRSLPPEAYDASALADDTGFAPEVPFGEGIARTVAWLRETEFAGEGA